VGDTAERLSIIIVAHIMVMIHTTDITAVITGGDSLKLYNFLRLLIEIRPLFFYIDLLAPKFLLVN